MKIDSKAAEQQAVLQVAKAMCAAIRTAPKAARIDNLSSMILAEDDLEVLAVEMERLAPILEKDFFLRDAENIRKSTAVVLAGATYKQRGLGKGCSLCNFDGCAECTKNNAVCVYEPLDLGIAIGSAVSLAADARIDNRVMFSVGKAALSLKLFPEEVKIVMGIPLAVRGKSPYYDRDWQGPGCITK